MPMDPIDFIRRSRFRHHRRMRRDQGYDKRENEWQTNDDHDAKYYDIPVDYINSFGLHSNGDNRRPTDSNRGSEWNVFLQPRENPKGIAAPDEVVPTFYVPLVNPPLNEHGNGVLHIQYWVFYGYNVATWPARHQGDWEHATAVLKHGVFIGAYMFQHTGSEYYSAEELEYQRGHWVVYSARGTHANHPRAGSFWYPGGREHTSADGPRMRTWLNIHLLKNQPWKDYAGAWGEVGIGLVDFTTGPLGPWHKRFTQL
jgi:Vacuolar protein sorting-associated protein 62